jgi:hypothetical protein
VHTCVSTNGGSDCVRSAFSPGCAYAALRNTAFVTRRMSKAKKIKSPGSSQRSCQLWAEAVALHDTNSNASERYRAHMCCLPAKIQRCIEHVRTERSWRNRRSTRKNITNEQDKFVFLDSALTSCEAIPLELLGAVTRRQCWLPLISSALALPMDSAAHRTPNAVRGSAG